MNRQGGDATVGSHQESDTTYQEVLLFALLGAVCLGVLAVIGKGLTVLAGLGWPVTFLGILVVGALLGVVFTVLEGVVR